jgi:hypothetical protein
MRHCNGCAHETKGKGAGRLEQFFRDIGAEKTYRDAILGEMGRNFSITQ